MSLSRAARGIRPARLVGARSPASAPAITLPTKVALVGVILGATLFSRFGVDVGGYSVDFSLFAQYAVLASLALSGGLRSDLPRAVLFAGLLLVAFSSWLLNMQASSATSLLLLVAIYLPFVFQVRRDNEIADEWRWTIDVFRAIALFCAVAGIVQFLAQFVIHDPWLFNWSDYIPDGLRAIGVYNTVISVGELHKSNGFFFREPSNFSQIMALALICEMCLKTGKRPVKLARMGVLGLALLLTYSGTGILTLLIGMMFPLNAKTLVRGALLALAGLFVVVVFGDALNLSFTLNRVSEFSSEGSSAFARFVAPARLLAENLAADFWTPVVGNGPGTISRVQVSYMIFDPTWAKAMFEYGVAGFGLIMALVLYTTTQFRSPAEIRASLFFCWLLMGGHLLSPEKTTLVYVFAALWPAVRANQGLPGRRNLPETSMAPLSAPRPQEV